MIMKTNRWKLPVLPVMALILAASRTVAQETKTRGPGVASEDSPATHNMLVVGTEAVFLSHLPKFDGLNERESDYTSPHRY
jgi:hypothetical protein